MPSDPGLARKQFKPPPDFGQRTIPVTAVPERTWFRLHRSSLPPVQFGKLTHHRFSHPDAGFEMLYLGATLQTCLWEVFGDDVFNGARAIAATKWNGRSVSEITVRKLSVCAVSTERTRSAMGVDKASLMSTDLSIPQAWSLAVQEHGAGFQAIWYTSQFLDQPCLALFNRPGIAASLRVRSLGLLSELESAVDLLEDQNAALV